MTYDIIIIGGGPGGYIAAERAGAQGKSVLLVEKANLGGVCLNEGCIPTKTLLNSAKLYAHGIHAGRFGVTFDNPRFDLAKAMAWKNEVMEKLRGGIAYLMKKYKVTVVNGNGMITGQGKVMVNGTVYEGTNIIIATGSSTFVPPIPGADSKSVLTSTEILSLSTMPKSLAVIGGGVIGIEFASFFSTLGVKTTVIEMMPEIIPFMDAELAPMLRKAMSSVDFQLNAKVESISGNTVKYTKDGKQESVTADIILMAVGRRPNTKGMGFESIGLDFDNKGVRVNDKMQTNVPGVYAIGDVTGKYLLAHAASRMAEVAVNNIAGVRDMMRYHAMPWAVYGIPEAAGAGLTEAELKKANVPYRTASMPLRVNGRFLAENGEDAGVCKVLVHEKTSVLLGVHMLGGACSEMIYGAAAMIESELRVKDISEIIFPHPSISEIIKDTAISLH
ncbi:MAG: dihydrolipoyl dehydrogenase [Spirochaetes bacterium]|nr:dihydrolipoyl dehydrogenase [Spirochaetota bacterium]